MNAEESGDWIRILFFIPSVINRVTNQPHQLKQSSKSDGF